MVEELGARRAGEHLSLAHDRGGDNEGLKRLRLQEGN